MRVKHGEYRGGVPNATHTERFTYVPSLGLVRPQGSAQWIELYPARRRELDRSWRPSGRCPARSSAALLSAISRCSRNSSPPREGAVQAIAIQNETSLDVAEPAVAGLMRCVTTLNSVAESHWLDVEDAIAVALPSGAVV